MEDPAKRVSAKQDGAARGIRTPDPVITNDVLYQLSYCGGPCCSQARACVRFGTLISGTARLGKTPRSAAFRKRRPLVADSEPASGQRVSFALCRQLLQRARKPRQPP